MCLTIWNSRGMPSGLSSDIYRPRERVPRSVSSGAKCGTDRDSCSNSQISCQRAENMVNWSWFRIAPMTHQKSSIPYQMEIVVSDQPDRAPTVPLTPRERARLASILSRLSSPYDNERATAGLLASAFVTKHHLTWFDLTMFLRAPPVTSDASREPQSQQDRRQSSRRDWRGYCRRRRTMAGETLNLST
jgi:hypothetical protein